MSDYQRGGYNGGNKGGYNNKPSYGGDRKDYSKGGASANGGPKRKPEYTLTMKREGDENFQRLTGLFANKDEDGNIKSWSGRTEGGDSFFLWVYTEMPKK